MRAHCCIVEQAKVQSIVNKVHATSIRILIALADVIILGRLDSGQIGRSRRGSRDVKSALASARHGEFRVKLQAACNLAGVRLEVIPEAFSSKARARAAQAPHNPASMHDCIP